MHELKPRLLAICLVGIASSAIWLPVVCASADDGSSAVTQSSVRSPLGPRCPADYIRTDFTVENGLPDNVVDAIVETENGVLWVGTQSGLARFDGRGFTPVDLQTTGSPAQGEVHSMIESSGGDLWVGPRVRDDGKGIDFKVLEQTRRPGHWGLPGVRERAQRIGSQLDFWSQPGAGTEVELVVPAVIAYETAVDRSKAKHLSQSRNS